MPTNINPKDRHMQLRSQSYQHHIIEYHPSVAPHYTSAARSAIIALPVYHPPACVNINITPALPQHAIDPSPITISSWQQSARVCCGCWPLAAQDSPFDWSIFGRRPCSCQPRLTTALLVHPAPPGGLLPPMAACTHSCFPDPASCMPRTACYSLPGNGIVGLGPGCLL